MKVLILLFISLLSSLTWAAPAEKRPLKMFVRIEHKNGALVILRSSTGDIIPGVFSSKEIEKKLSSIAQDEEALIEGYINYRPISSGEKTSFAPYFSIESVRPVSLNRLSAQDYVAPESSFDFAPMKQDFRPYTIPVTTEVASALTMTSTFLLMDSLSSGDGEPSGRQDLRKGLIISAGTMATVLFIYDQLKKGPKAHE